MISHSHPKFDLLVLQILLLSLIEPDLGPIPVLGLDLIRTPGLVFISFCQATVKLSDLTF